jgi:hypothetical protein
MHHKIVKRFVVLLMLLLIIAVIGFAVVVSWPL